MWAKLFQEVLGVFDGGPGMMFQENPMPIQLGASSWFTAKLNITSSGGLVSRWENLVNSSNPYLQAVTGSQPSVGTFNGLPMISFPAAKSITTSSSPVNSSTTFSHYAVSTLNAATSTLGEAANIVNSGLFLSRYEPPISNKATSFIFAGGSYEPRLSSASAPTANTPFIARTIYVDATGAHSFKINNLAETTNTRTPSGSTISNATIVNGALNVTQSLYMFEQIWFSRALTAAEDLQVIQYLSKEWGIAL